MRTYTAVRAGYRYCLFCLRHHFLEHALNYNTILYCDSVKHNGGINLPKYINAFGSTVGMQLTCIGVVKACIFKYSFVPVKRI